MHAAPYFADERALEMNAQDFRAGFLPGALLRDIQRDSRCRPASVFGTGRDGGGQERRGAILDDLPGDRFQSVAVCFHHVTPARAMDVNVKETWNRYFLECGNLGSAGGHAQAAARSDRVDHIVTNENASVMDLGGGGQSPPGVDKGGRHGRGTS